MTDYTPSTDNVRDCYVYAGDGMDGSTRAPQRILRAEFDRWLESERSRVWDKAHALWTGSDSDPNSPYRATGRTRAGSVGSEGVGSAPGDPDAGNDDERGEG